MFFPIHLYMKRIRFRILLFFKNEYRVHVFYCENSNRKWKRMTKKQFLNQNKKKR